MNTNAQNLIKKADADGSVELASGVWLQTSASLQDEQAGWSEFDEAKEFDFTASPYWITTDDGQTIAISGATDPDLLQHI